MPKRPKPKAAPRNQFRIIGGKWRGRKFSFPENPAIRPSPDRVRETLFNWLIGDIADANILDCFAGSGALGLEALSRGAKQATFVELDTPSANTIWQHLETLSASALATVINGDALSQLDNSSAFDIVFLDPPFNCNLLDRCLDQLSQTLAIGGLVYVESELDWSSQQAQFTTVKSKQAGEVKYQLLEKSA